MNNFRNVIDPLLLTSVSPPRMHVRIGDVDVTEFVMKATIREEDRVPHADLILHAGRLPRFDYMAQVAIDRPHSKEPYFGGFIYSAVLAENGSLHLTIGAVTALKEFGVTPWVASRVGAPDLMQMHIRVAGFRQGNIQMQESLQPGVETFEVLQPVAGLTVQRALDIGDNVRLVPPDHRVLERFGSQPAVEILAPRLASADSFAITYLPGFRWMSDAEEAGLSAIGRALNWIVVQIRNGESIAPDGRVNTFSRTHLRGFPRTNDLVLVTGMATGRSWLHDIGTPPVLAGNARVQDVLRERLWSPTDPRSLQAYSAFRRAADEESSVATRVGALWETLEYYAVHAPDSRWFQKAEVRALRKRAVEGLSDQQTKRLDHMLSQLNSSSLQERIWRLAEADGVAATAGEREAVARTRQFRNSMLHGSDLPDLDHDEMNYATSVVARLLVARARHHAAGF